MADLERHVHEKHYDAVVTAASGLHPRIYFTSATKSAWAARLAVAGDVRTRLQTVVTAMDNGTLPAAGSSSSTTYQYHSCLRTLIATTYPVTWSGGGIAYANARPWYVAQAIAAAQVDTARPAESALFCYDWLYDDLTDTEKNTLNGLIISTSETWDAANPLDDGTGMAVAQYLLAGLAADPGLGTTHDASIALRLTRLTRMWEHLDLSNLCGGRRGGWAQGHTYMAHGHPSTVARTFWRTLEAYRTVYGYDYTNFYTEGVGGPGPRGQNGFCAATVYAPWYLWARGVPTGVADIRFAQDVAGDVNDGLAASGLNPQVYPDILSSARYHSTLFPEQAALAQWFLTTYGRTPTDAWVHLLWGRTVTASPPATVRLSVPATTMNSEHSLTWRTYEDTANNHVNDTRVDVELRKWVGGAGGYYASKAGVFAVSRNGPIFVPCGLSTHDTQLTTVGGTTVELAMQNCQYGQNGILVVDPSVYDADKDKNPGTRTITAEPTSTSGFTVGSTYDRGGLTRYRSTSPYVAEGDMTRAYNSTISVRSGYTAKVSLVARRFVFLPRTTATGPDFLIAHDFTTRASAAMEVQWKLRYPATFTVNGTEIAGAPARLHNPTGIQTWQYTGATTIHGEVGGPSTGTTGVGAESYTTVLEPAGFSIVKTCRVSATSPNPYLATTTNGGYAWTTPWGAPMPLKGANYISTQLHWPWFGYGNIDIVPGIGGLAHRFFVVMEICAAGATQTTVTGLSNWTYTGGGTDPFGGGAVQAVDACRIGTTTLVLASQGAWTASAAPLDPVYADCVNQAVEVDATGTYQIIAIDCEPSRTYTIATYDTATATETTVTTEAADSQGVLVVSGVAITATHILLLK